MDAPTPDPDLPENAEEGSEIAIIGLACRLPGAADADEFWTCLRDGVEGIARLSDEQILAAGVDPALLTDPRYVKAAPLLAGYDRFDAGFFSYNAREAEIMDPQQRLLLECAWAALEHAGYDPLRGDGTIGVYAGSKTNTYLFHLASNPAVLRAWDPLQLILGGDQAMLATRISYKLNLKGPSYGVQSACSTSLVAVHLASQALLVDECRMALAGGVAINVPHEVGYLYEEGGILSPDGHCRPFDAAAAGTVFGSGVGVVVLKRLSDALADGDRIWAVILGSAINNDGSEKANFTAPSVEGQTDVILEALACAGVSAESISYLEAHGTGTALGDPIEVLALTNAFRASTDQEGFCAIGSVKGNVGHLDAAAGMASLIKAVLALEHEAIPPTLHFTSPNPKIDFEHSPFRVHSELAPWKAGPVPRRVGVSSLGFGGTNAHVVVQEAPPREPSGPSRPGQLLVLSARSPAALEAATENLARHLAAHPELNLADVAYTLQVGRHAFDHRRIAVCRDRQEAVKILAPVDAERVATGEVREGPRRALYLFPGQGAQYPGMGLELYQEEPVFRREIDRAAEILEPHLGCDLREVLYPAAEKAAAAAERLRKTALTQPALFVVEYALARLWMAWGIRPWAMIGHSIGEYVAACLAGVFCLEDALAVVAERGRLMAELPGGAMLAVPLPEEEVEARLSGELSLAAVNGPRRSVVSGPTAAVAAWAEELAEQGVKSRRLHTSHAFHSAMMDPILEPFTQRLREVRLEAPRIRYASNLTGAWITAEEATDPTYWARHLRSPVRFGDGLGAVLREADCMPLEVGPGTSLATFVRQHPARSAETVTLPSLPHPNDRRSALDLVLGSLGKLWLAGVEVDWEGFHAAERRRRVPLPTYPFERQRYWIDSAGQGPAAARSGSLEKTPQIEDWFYRPVWKQAQRSGESETADGCWLVLSDVLGLGDRLAERLVEEGGEVVRVTAGEAFARTGEDLYVLRPGEAEDYRSLFAELGERGRTPGRCVHLRSVTEEPGDGGPDAFRRAQDEGFYSLIFLAQAWVGQYRSAPLSIDVVSNHVQDATGDERLCPEKSTVLGPCLVIPQEHPSITCRSIDVVLEGAGDDLVERLVAELRTPPEDRFVVLRGADRRVEDFERFAGPAEGASFRPRGVYLIIGGLGGIGLVLARHLAATVEARLILTRRSPIPAAGDDSGDDPAIGALGELEALGAEVMAVSADLADEARMREVVAAARERFGTLHGVIHTAGVLAGDSFRPVQQTTRQECELHFGPKAYGLYVLERVLAQSELDFCLVYSSVSAILGGLGYVGYTAANLFMDHFVQRHNRTHSPPWISVDWDSWHHQPLESSSSSSSSSSGEGGGLGVTLTELAMTPEEGIETLRRILALSESTRVVISTGELRPRLDQWVRLPLPAPAARSAAPLATGSELERQIAAVWCRVLERDEVGTRDNFFDLGGDSLLAMQLVSELHRELGVRIAPVVLFEAPTVGALAEYLCPEPAADEAAAGKPQPAAAREAGSGSSEIAIIGMSGRFPGARSVDAFWDNLCAGRESISFFSDDELLAAGVDPETLCDPCYVKARPILDQVELFDAGLFGYSPREAEIMDPQHRLFLECAWEALEDAGYDTERYGGTVGVYAGASISTYLQKISSDPELRKSVDTFQALIGNDKDALTTRVSYKLNLRGPSFAIQSFCSTSLVAVHMASQALRSGEADMALAGGVSIIVPQVGGYFYQEGGITSRDGHVRAFDARASGMVFGNGVGVVVLKRLADALRDGDRVDAVIRGTAINNDGSLKAGYSAASIEGQSEVVVEALAHSGVDPETITYVEAHGTGTGLGDPVELAALTRAFRAHTEARQFCAIGSVKTNVGHLDRAAGVTGLIKTVLALQHRKIPPTLHFEEPNPEIDFATSPFYVTTDLVDWPADGGPRRAGVTSLGFGGTNVHAVVEEAPEVPASDPCPGPQVLILSARTATALEAAGARLAAALESDRERNLADVAFTLQVGRRELEHRRVVVCGEVAEAVTLLRGGDCDRVLSGVHQPARRRLVFLFPGQGSQYPGMGRELYDREPVFRRELDRCAEILAPLGVELRELLFPAPEALAAAGERLAETRFTQPVLFAVEYALARTWMAWGLRPEAMIGHSIGEYVAACLAGVFDLEDALALVAERGRLIGELPGGAMLGVALAEDDLLPRLVGTGLSLAAVNAPDRLVVSGPEEAVAELAAQLAAEGVEGRRLHTSHAFHSAMLEPVVEPFARRVAAVERRPPRVRFVSCLSGTWITAEEATDPEYWAAQLRREVRFSAGVTELLKDDSRVLLEVGPGTTLSTLTRRHLDPNVKRPVVASLPSPKEKRAADAAVLTALGRLWLAGLSPDWPAVHGGAHRRRLALPTYPFERRRHWVEAAPEPVGPGLSPGHRPEQWLFSPGWKTSRPPRPEAPETIPAAGPWVLLSDDGALARALAAGIRQRGWPLTAGGLGEGDAVFDSLPEPPAVVLYVPSMAPSAGDLLALARRLGTGPTALWVLTDGLHQVLGQEAPAPSGASLLAVCRAINRGYPHLVCRHLDLLPGLDGDAVRSRLAQRILDEVLSEPRELTIAYRGNHRWVPVVEAVDPGGAAAAAELPAGTWLLTGGLGEPGFSVAGSLANGEETRLVLLEPEPLPPREQWDGLARETPPSAEEMNAFLATLAAEEGIAVDLAERSAEIPDEMRRLAGEAKREAVPEGFDAVADALSAAWAHRFLAGAVDAGASCRRDELAAALRVVPRFERFFRYLLHVLERAGMVELAGDAVTFRPVPAEKTDAETLTRLAVELYPALAPGIECLAHCAAHYPEAFSGRVEPVSILYPDGSSEMLRQVMEIQDRYSVNRIFYPLMAERIRELAASLSHRRLRILELGAGDGNLTWELAEALRGSNVEYHFTDIGRTFVVNGRKIAAERGLDFMRFGVVDATRDPAEQGYERYGFDVLVAFDVVHTTPHVRETMRNLRRFLAPGGWAMILEPTRDQHWISMIWGLAEGWWLFADDELRTLHPLLEPQQWEQVLAALGFSASAVFPLDPEERATVDHSLLVVQQPTDLRPVEYLEMAVERWHERRRRIAERVGRVRALERRAAVELVAVDLEDAGAVEAAVRRVRESRGPVRGVVHAAGPWNGTGDRGDELDAEAYARSLAKNAVVVGALEAALAGEDPDLALLVSPLEAAGDELPGPCQAADYYLQAHASRPDAKPLSWQSVAWGVPVDVGETGGRLPCHLGAAALAAVGGCPQLSRMVVTHRPPAAMAAAWNRLPAILPPADDAALPEAPGDDYVAPEGEEEKRIAAIWQQVLGVERVGLHDDFFELGGDSLIATQIHSRVTETFDVAMAVDRLFALPTVAEQAREVARIAAAEDERDDQEIIDLLARMSDEDVAKTLRELTPSGE